MKKLLTFTLLLLLNINLLNAQCNEDSLTVTVNGTCNGESNGSIIIGGLSKLVPQPGEMYSCETGELVSGTNITVNSGEIKRVQVAAWTNITINGGTLIVCGSVTVSSLNLQNGGALILNGGSLAFHTPVTIPNGCRIVNANGSVAFYNAVQVNGLLFNWNGNMVTYSQLNKGIGGNIMNNSSFFNASTNKTIEDNYDEDIDLKRFYPIHWENSPENDGKPYAQNLPSGNQNIIIAHSTCAIKKTINVPVFQPVNASINLNSDENQQCNGKSTVNIQNPSGKYFYKWFKNENPIDTLSDLNQLQNLCSGSYSVTIRHNNFCAKTIYFEIEAKKIYAHDHDHDSIPDENDTIALLFTSTDINKLWDISMVDTSKYILVSHEDSALYPQINPSVLLNNFTGQIGSEFLGNFDYEFVEDDFGKIEKISKYSVKIDGSGDIKYKNIQFNNSIRYKVKEEYLYIFHDNYITPEPNLDLSPYDSIMNLYYPPNKISTDTFTVVLDNYYWLSLEDSSLLMSFQEKSKGNNVIGEFYQELYLKPVNTNNNHPFDYEAFKALVNLNSSPNPVVNLTTISYNLPEDAQVNLLFHNITGNVSVPIVNGFQTEGTYSYVFDASNYVHGSYRFTLTVNGISVSNIIIK